MLSGLISCSVKIPDAAYLDGQMRFDEGYVPDSRIHGKWLKFDSHTIQYNVSQTEYRVDYEFFPKGRGRIREVTQFHTTGNRVVIEAPISWERISPFMWKVSIPSSDRYRVVEAENAGISGSRAAISFRMQSGNGRLYDIDNLKTLVPIHEAREYIDQERGRMRRGEAMPFVVGP